MTTAELMGQLDGTVRYWARAYFRRWRQEVPLDDLLQEAHLAAFQAVEKYDAGTGIPLSSYASPRIKGALSAFVARQRTSVRVPQTTAREHRLKGTPIRVSCASFDAPLGSTEEGDSGTLLDVTPSAEDFDAWSLPPELIERIDALPRHLRTALLARYVGGSHFRNIARQLGGGLQHVKKLSELAVRLLAEPGQLRLCECCGADLSQHRASARFCSRQCKVNLRKRRAAVRPA